MISMFARMGRLLIILVTGCILVVAIVVFGIPLVLNALGYWVNPTATEMAEIAAEKNDVNQCRRLISYGLFAPPTGEKRRVCIRMYAELTKDPSACELLMPSEYGLSCVGGAEESASCKMRDGYVASDDGSIPYKDCRLNDHSRTKLQNDCCLIARVTFVQSENNCLSLQNDKDLYEECISNMSFKKHDPTACAIIENKNRLAACIVRAAAILKNPSICDGCKKPVENLSDLQ